MRELCYLLPCRREDILGHREDDYLGECILKANHSGPHLLLTPEGRYIKWETDWDCDCEGCQDFSSGDFCYFYGEVDKEEAEKMLGECN